MVRFDRDGVVVVSRCDINLDFFLNANKTIIIVWLIQVHIVKIELLNLNSNASQNLSNLHSLAI